MLQKIPLWIAIPFLLAACVAAYFALRPSHNDANFPQGTWWLCKSCGAAFPMTMKQLSDHNQQHYGEPIPCPKCGKTDTVRAQKCPKCGKVYELTRNTQKCPACGAPVVAPDE